MRIHVFAGLADEQIGKAVVRERQRAVRLPESCKNLVVDMPPRYPPCPKLECTMRPGQQASQQGCRAGDRESSCRIVLVIDCRMLGETHHVRSRVALKTVQRHIVG